MKVMEKKFKMSLKTKKYRLIRERVLKRLLFKKPKVIYHIDTRNIIYEYGVNYCSRGGNNAAHKIARKIIIRKIGKKIHFQHRFVPLGFIEDYFS